MSKRSRRLRWLITVLASASASVVIAITFIDTAPNAGRNHVEQVQQQDDVSVASEEMDAERLARWQEARGLHLLQEQARREKAEQLKLAEEERAIWQKQVRRTEARMQNVLQPHFPPNVLDIEGPLVEYEVQVLYAYSDEGCVACEIRVPRKPLYNELSADTHPLIQAYRLPWPDAP